MPLAWRPEHVEAALRRLHLPAGHLERGRLAGAVGTEQRQDLAPGDGQVDPVQHLDLAVGGVDTAELEDRRERGRLMTLPPRRCRRPGSGPAPTSRFPSRVLLGVVGRPGRRHVPGRRPGPRPAYPPQDGAEVEDVDARAHPHDESHVVLDQSTPIPASASWHQEVAQLVALGVVRPGGGLVEQEEAGPGGQGAGQLEQPGLAGGQGVGRLRRPGAQSDQGQDCVGHRRGVGTIAGPAAADLGRGQDVLAHGEGAEDLEALEGAGDPEAGPLVRLEPGQVRAVEEDAAGAEALQAADGVEAAWSCRRRWGR